MKIFEKAGVQGKWRAWVPIYNSMVFSKLGDLSPWLILIAIGASILLGWIPVIGSVIGIAAFVVTSARRVACRSEAAEGSRLADPLLLPQHRLARHPRLRQVALEHRDPRRTVGWERIPLRPHDVGRHPEPDPGRRISGQSGHSARTGRLPAARGIPASGTSRRLRAAGRLHPAGRPTCRRPAGCGPTAARDAAARRAGAADHAADDPASPRPAHRSHEQFPTSPRRSRRGLVACSSGGAPGDAPRGGRRSALAWRA